MWAELRNEARLDFWLEAAGPLVVREAKPSGIDPLLPDMPFVRDGQGLPYLPGSSLKGVLRSRAERILRGLGGWRAACDPFDRSQSCSRRLQRQMQGQTLDGGARYQASCYACRLFGSTALRGRLACADAPLLPDRPLVMGERSHVGIDRKTGGPAGQVLFQPETVEAGTFAVRITLTNFALWQLLLLEVVLRDLDAGFVGIGGASTRGYGRVRLVPESVQVRWRDLRALPPGQLWGYQGEADAVLAPLQTQPVRGLYGYEVRWSGLQALQALAAADGGLEAALQRDAPLKKEGAG